MSVPQCVHRVLAFCLGELLSTCWRHSLPLHYGLAISGLTLRHLVVSIIYLVGLIHIMGDVHALLAHLTYVISGKVSFGADHGLSSASPLYVDAHVSIVVNLLAARGVCTTSQRAPFLASRLDAYWVACLMFQTPGWSLGHTLVLHLSYLVAPLSSCVVQHTLMALLYI